MNYLIAIINFIISLILIIPAYRLGNLNYKYWIGLVIIVIGTFFYPIAQTVRKKSYPILIEILICVHLSCALSLTTAFEIYEKISFWDNILHTMYGVVLMFFGYLFIVNIDTCKMKRLYKFVFLITFVLGFAAIWEFIEYFGYYLLDHDFQHMYDFKAGETPMDDTMIDMLVAGLAALILYFIGLILSISCKDKFEKFNDSLKVEERRKDGLQ